VSVVEHLIWVERCADGVSQHCVTELGSERLYSCDPVEMFRMLNGIHSKTVFAGDVVTRSLVV